MYFKQKTEKNHTQAKPVTNALKHFLLTFADIFKLILTLGM